jgi:hypothetical protein
VGQNRTDGAHAADVVPMRYMLALLYPVTATLEPFLARKGVPRRRCRECARRGPNPCFSSSSYGVSLMLIRKISEGPRRPGRHVKSHRSPKMALPIRTCVAPN